MGKRPTSKELLSTGWSEGPGAPGSRPARAPGTNAVARGEGERPPALSVWAPEAPPPGTSRRPSIPRLLLGREGRGACQGSGALGGGGGLRLRRAVPAPALDLRPALSGPPPAFWLASPHSRPARALPEYGAAVLRGHPARAPGRAGPAAAGGPACPAELAPPGRALRAPRLLLPVCAEGDQAAHAEDAGVLDAGGTARRVSPPPPPRRPRLGTSWSQQQSARYFCGADPRGLAFHSFHSCTLPGCLPGVPFFPFSNPDFDCQLFGTPSNPLFGPEKRDKGHPLPSGFFQRLPPRSPARSSRESAPGKPWARPPAPQSRFLCVAGFWRGRRWGGALFRQSGK